MGNEELTLGKVLSAIGLVLIMSWTIFPLYWVFNMSIQTPIDVISYPPKFYYDATLENYSVVLIGKAWLGKYETVQTDFPRYYLNSLIVCSGAVAISMLLGVPAAYSLARFAFKGKENFAFTLLSFRFAPGLIVIIPLFVIFRRLGLYGTYYGMMLAYQLITLPFSVWLMRGFFEDIPIELEHAARIDGYSWWGVFRKVNLPLVAPGIAATAILSFIFAWNEFLFGYVLSSDITRPVTPSLMGFISYEQVLWGQMAAAAIITLLPSVILAIFIQKYLVRGLTFGAVKG
ncbi:MAG: carbohydrate ABC transporter permease [Atribacterota bacterium]|jgi:multiple sugar transport system permease protein|uniref:Trehalose transport system permease protein SugB n=1 Tax=Candidatus Atribacter allofermentans TaxID=1852833 RepID=A0A1V5SIQ3_9BACT|nr:carbohydrate ABC transporter permease [Atribacterota bacterium]OQA54388.1 MAG: Trehalose transport system permease protein SugB [Candidatus Atribacteria bacterium ADurb.Bin276]